MALSSFVRMMMRMIVPMLMSIMGMVFTMMVLMTMVPKLGLVEQKEEQQSNQQGDKKIVRLDATFKGLRQQMQKRSCQQSASRQAEHVLCVATDNAKAEPSSQPNTANA
jgi:hypothetical protein